MKIDRNKFPFKWMLKIINTLEESNSLSSFRIAEKIGSCTFDASEVSRMLHFITFFGKVEVNSKNQWRVIFSSKDKPPEINFRMNFIEKLIDIIKVLDNQYKPVEKIAQETSYQVSDIFDNLNFLILITNKGIINFNGIEYQEEWNIRPWTLDY